MGRSNVRQAVASDTAACTEVWRSTIDPSLPDVDTPYPLYRHELDTGTLLVAEVDGRVVGFAGSISRGARWFLADLFVSPDAQGTGSGRRLLDELVGRDEPGAVRATMASDDPRAISLYTKLGMSPRWPCFALVGRPGRMTRSIDRTAPSVTRVDIDSLLDRSIHAGYSLSRRDLVYWESTAQASCFVVRGHGGAVVRPANEFSVSHPDAISIGPVFSQRSEELVGVLDAVIAEVRAGDPTSPIKLYVPGPSPALRPLLADGFEITGFDLHMSSCDHTGDASIPDPSRVLPSLDLL